MRRLLLPAVLLVRLLIASAFPASAEEAAGAPLLTLDQAELTLVKGKTQRLKTMLENVENPKKAKFTWESSDTAVATVDREGTVKAEAGRPSIPGLDQQTETQHQTTTKRKEGISHA